MTNVPPGDHAPIPGDDHQEVRIHNNYGACSPSSVWPSNPLQGIVESLEHEATPNMPQENPPSQSNIGRSPLAGAMSHFRDLISCAEQIANIVQPNLDQPGRLEQAYTEMMSAAAQAASYRSILQPGPPQQNQFATHGHSEDNILDQQNKPVLFWNGPRHQQFHVITNLHASLVVEDNRVMPSRHEERTRGLRYSYRLSSFRFGNTSFGVYVLESSIVNCQEVIQFFRSLSQILVEYRFIVHSLTSNLEQRGRFYSIEDLRRSVREEVYTEVLVRVRQEFAKRERNRPPETPAVLPAIDTDQGRSIVL